MKGYKRSAEVRSDGERERETQDLRRLKRRVSGRREKDSIILHDGRRLQDRRRSPDLERFRAHGTRLLRDVTVIVRALAVV